MRGTFFRKWLSFILPAVALAGIVWLTDGAGLTLKSAAQTTIQVVTETVKLTDPTHTLLLGGFGRGVAVEGDTLAVGAIYDRTGPDGASDGAVSVYSRNGAAWALQQKLYGANLRYNDTFGAAVAISGDTIVVGAPNGDVKAVNPTDSDTNEGYAMVFTRNNGTWTFQQKLFADDGQNNGLFGWEVALHGDTIVASNHVPSSPLRTAYIFTRSGGVWTLQLKLPCYGPVALRGDTLVASTQTTNEEGAVQIYSRSNGVWTRRQELFGDDGNYPTGFGLSLALAENTLVVGAPYEVAGSQDSNEGRIYIYARSGAGWVRKQKLASADVMAYDAFGTCVAATDQVIVAGTAYSGGSARTDAGAAYVFTSSLTAGGTNWTQQQKLIPSDGVKGEMFGIKVAIGGNTILVGAPNQGRTTMPNGLPLIPGAAYVYATPSAPARLVANVSAASYTGEALAPESIVTAFGSQLAMSTQLASGTLPTQIAGTSVRIKDSAGVERMSPLFFVSPSQINYQVPAGTASGAATVTITSGDGSLSAANVQVNPVFPGLFTADASGRGLAAAVVLRVKANGAQSYEPIGQYNNSQNRFVALPVDLGAPDDQVFLLLFGTGIRHHSSLANATAKVGGTNTPVSYAGAQNDFIGLDQVNALLPRSLAGRGELDVLLTVDGKAANTVRISVK